MVAGANIINLLNVHKSGALPAGALGGGATVFHASLSFGAFFPFPSIDYICCFSMALFE